MNLLDLTHPEVQATAISFSGIAVAAICSGLISALTVFYTLKSRVTVAAVRHSADIDNMKIRFEALNSEFGHLRNAKSAIKKQLEKQIQEVKDQQKSDMEFVRKQLENINKNTQDMSGHLGELKGMLTANTNTK